MVLDVDAIETLTLDSFTTLVDVHSETRNVLANYVEKPDSVARLWRSRAVDYRMVANFIDEYAPYRVTTRDALEYALGAHEIDLSDQEIDTINGVFEDLPIFGDVQSSARRIVAAGYDLYILSNGERSLLQTIVEQAGLESIISGTISADEIQTYKPDAAIYEHAADRANTSLDCIAHAATPWYDIYGAMAAGMGTVWVNRNNQPWETFNDGPDLIVDSLSAVADTFET